LGLIASYLLYSWTNTYKKFVNSSKNTGINVAEIISKKKKFPISILITEIELGDNFDPTNNVLTLSRSVASEYSITSVGITAHELGHVEQHFSGYFLLKIRTLIVPIVSIGSNFGMILLVIGIIIGLSQLAWLGVIFFASTTIFTLITLPLEIDASKRALKMIVENNLLVSSELPAVRRVLFAASLTYLASTLQSLGQLAYFIYRTSSINND